jgi:hypothetical protein
MNILQDIMGLITKRKIKTPSDNDYIVSAAYTDTQERLKPQPKMEASLLNIGALRKYIINSIPGPKVKDITTNVVAGVYTITNDDFSKTLVYTGSTDITIEFSSSIIYTEALSLNILQIGAGIITVAGSGININYTTDVLPISYGANSLMSVLFYTPTTLILSGNLKLA